MQTRALVTAAILYTAWKNQELWGLTIWGYLLVAAGAGLAGEVAQRVADRVNGVHKPAKSGSATEENRP